MSQVKLKHSSITAQNPEGDNENVKSDFKEVSRRLSLKRGSSQLSNTDSRDRACRLDSIKKFAEDCETLPVQLILNTSSKSFLGEGQSDEARH